MRLATIDHHDPRCTGCPACSAEMAHLLATGTFRAAENSQPGLRTAAMRTFRASGPCDSDLRTSAAHDDDEAPAPPSLNDAILRAHRPDAEGAAVRAARLRVAMRPVPPPEDSTPAMRAAQRRIYELEHDDVPAPPSNETVNARLRAARGLGPLPVPRAASGATPGDDAPPPPDLNARICAAAMVRGAK